MLVILFLLQQYYFPKAYSYEQLETYKVINEKNEIIPCKIYKEKDEMFYIIIFDDYDKRRLHIHLEKHLIGFPEFGYKNYKVTNGGKKLYLFEENLFYNNGVLFHPFSPIELNQVVLSQTKDKLELSTKYLHSLKEYGEKIIIMRNNTFLTIIILCFFIFFNCRDKKDESIQNFNEHSFNILIQGEGSFNIGYVFIIDNKKYIEKDLYSFVFYPKNLTERKLLIPGSLTNTEYPIYWRQVNLPFKIIKKVDSDTLLVIKDNKEFIFNRIKNDKSVDIEDYEKHQSLLKK